MKRLIAGSTILLGIAALIAGCGEPSNVDSGARIKDQSTVVTPFVMTDAQRQSMLEALADRDRILTGYGEPAPLSAVNAQDEPESSFVPTDEQLRSMAEAAEEQNRILSGYGEPAPRSVLTDAQRQSMVDASEEQNRILGGY